MFWGERRTVRRGARGRRERRTLVLGGMSSFANLEREEEGSR